MDVVVVIFVLCSLCAPARMYRPSKRNFFLHTLTYVHENRGYDVDFLCSDRCVCAVCVCFPFTRSFPSQRHTAKHVRLVDSKQIARTSKQILWKSCIHTLIFRSTDWLHFQMSSRLCNVYEWNSFYGVSVRICTCYILSWDYQRTFHIAFSDLNQNWTELFALLWWFVYLLSHQIKLLGIPNDLAKQINEFQMHWHFSKDLHRILYSYIRLCQYRKLPKSSGKISFQMPKSSSLIV